MSEKLLVAKMHGAGNDFVVVAAVPPPAPLDGNWVRSVADRRRGVGADGVLFVEPPESAPSGERQPLRMHFYNCDGGRAGLCLNGSRCVALRAFQLGWTGSELRIATEHRVLEARVEDPAPDRISATVSLRVPAPSRPATRMDLPDGRCAWAVDTGDPHLVVEVDAAAVADPRFEARARPLREWSEPSPTGSNVHFVHRGERGWEIRSFERGVEGETLACGSGCLSAVAALAPRSAEAVALRTRSGEVLRVLPGADFFELAGPAVLVFETRIPRWRP